VVAGLAVVLLELVVPVELDAAVLLPVALAGCPSAACCSTIERASNSAPRKCVSAWSTASPCWL